MDMQGRIHEGPQVALGVDSSASGEQIHSAFLQLTKRFHPARFGRMSNEVQRLSNEVFLGIKSAHDILLRSVGAPPRGSNAKSSQTMPVLHAEGSNRTTTARIPIGQPQRPSGTGQTPVIPRTLTPSRIAPQQPGGPVISRTLTPGRVMPPGRAAGTPVSNTPAFGVRTLRQGTPPERPATPPERPATPVRAGTPPNARHPTPPQGSQPLQQKTAPVFDDRNELQRALDLINARDWAGARGVLHGLIARTPSKQYRALVCYTRGREAHAEGKGEEAKMEYDRALHLDPNLDRAATALRELMRRR
jgi:hypothetical protein